MSREKECKCCHEWWYASDIKQDLCPNCYDYFKQLKQQLVEKDKMHLLDEKEFQHYCAYKQIEPAIKGCLDREREYEKQFAEKDKEIERLKNLFELNNEVVINQGKEIFDLRVQVLQQKQNQTQLALQELEKVKNFVDGRTYCANYIKKRIKELKGEKDDG